MKGSVGNLNLKLHLYDLLLLYQTRPHIHASFYPHIGNHIGKQCLMTMTCNCVWVGRWTPSDGTESNPALNVGMQGTTAPSQVPNRSQGEFHHFCMHYGVSPESYQCILRNGISSLAILCMLQLGELELLRLQIGHTDSGSSCLQPVAHSRINLSHN